MVKLYVLFVFSIIILSTLSHDTKLLRRLEVILPYCIASSASWRETGRGYSVHWKLLGFPIRQNRNRSKQCGMDGDGIGAYGVGNDGWRHGERASRTGNMEIKKGGHRYPAMSRILSGKMQARMNRKCQDISTRHGADAIMECKTRVSGPYSQSTEHTKCERRGSEAGALLCRREHECENATLEYGRMDAVRSCFRAGVVLAGMMISGEGQTKWKGSWKNDEPVYVTFCVGSSFSLNYLL